MFLEILDGKIQVSVNGGGTPPYNFNWTNQGNINSSILNDLSVGTYDLEISDSNNCRISSSFEIDQSKSLHYQLSLKVQLLLLWRI